MAKAKPQTPVGLIVDEIGVSTLARLLGHENLSTVSSWKSRNSIPVEYWPKLIDAGMTVDRLLEAHTAHASPAPTELARVG